ncbi:hypothetical protein [Clostridium acidisoli]|uniref:hypothetical protein n=1 Tax=Clostridium acidisoli TaxID=91624 RepID=UPI001594A256|nr:hypothetical protein [Clostridium acidisoli]
MVNRLFCATVGAVTEEVIKEYIENRDKEDMKDIFTIEDKKLENVENVHRFV